MNGIATRSVCGLFGLFLLTSAASAGDGLTVPDVDPLWSRWQTRFSVTLERPLAGLTPVRTPSLQRAELMGDYYVPSFSLAPSSSWQGGLRATGGLIVGHPGLSPTTATASPTQVGQTRFGFESSNGIAPYVGVGYTGLSRRSGWGFSADLGVLVHGGGAGLRLGGTADRAQGLDDALRDIRLSPMMQLGVHYAF